MNKSFPLRAATGVLALAAVLALSGCEAEEEEGAAPIRPVRAVTADVQEGGEAISVAGTIESRAQVDLGFRIGGRLVERDVDVGDEVAAGQVIARLDSADEENGVRAAEAGLSAALGTLSEARINYDRQRQLYQRQIAARAAFERAEQVFTSAQGSADAAEAQLAIAERRLNDTVLYADGPGIVTAVGAETGEVVQPGRMIVQLARAEGKDAVFDVAAGLVDTVPPNAEITVALSNAPSTTATGRVREVAPRADAATGTIRVRVGLIDPPAAMRLGSTVIGRATVGGTPGIELPATALTSSDGSPAVWVVDPDSFEVALRPVVIDRFSPASVRVGEGLEQGEVVVTAGIQALRPGQEVRLLETAP